MNIWIKILNSVIHKNKEKYCNCICHLPIYTKSWCEHCKGDNVAGRKLIQKKKKFYTDNYS